MPVDSGVGPWSGAASIGTTTIHRIAGLDNRRSWSMLRSRGSLRSGSPGAGRAEGRNVDRHSRGCSDVGCCVVDSRPVTRRRLPDVMLLARSPGQLFGQPAIVPYRFVTAFYRLLFRQPFCRERCRGIGLDLPRPGCGYVLTAPPESASGHQCATRRRPVNSPTPDARTATTTVSRGPARASGSHLARTDGRPCSPTSSTTPATASR